MLQSLSIEQMLRQSDGQILFKRLPLVLKKGSKRKQRLSKSTPLSLEKLTVIQVRAVSMSVSKVHLKIGLSLQFTESKVEERDGLQVYKTNRKA